MIITHAMSFLNCCPKVNLTPKVLVSNGIEINHVGTSSWEYKKL